MEAESAEKYQRIDLRKKILSLRTDCGVLTTLHFDTSQVVSSNSNWR